MTEAVPKQQVADEPCEECGYEPELQRTLGSFQVFAVSFRIHLGRGRHLRNLRRRPAERRTGRDLAVAAHHGVRARVTGTGVDRRRYRSASCLPAGCTGPTCLSRTAKCWNRSRGKPTSSNANQGVTRDHNIDG